MTPDNLQRIKDFISYRNRLKAAIVHSNAATTVNINGNEYTVAEAIERKTSIQYEKNLLAVLKRQYANVTNRIESHNKKMEQDLKRLIEVDFGKDQVKSTVDNVEHITETYMKANKAEAVDPLNLENRINNLEDAIMNFEKEVDLSLSESNAITKINVAETPPKTKNL